jgi:creatinine amidohydrolase
VRGPSRRQLRAAGDYLPLITDTAVATVIAQELAHAYPLLRLPPVTISCSHEHSAWAGTVSISASTLYAVINDIYSSIANSGLTSQPARTAAESTA